MNKIKRVLLFLVILLFSTFQFVNAQPNLEVELGRSTSSTVKKNGGASFEASFSELGFEGPLVLHGPYQQVSTTFSLPKDWLVNAPVQLEMKVDSELQSLMEVFTTENPEDTQLNKKGLLKIEMNGTKVGEVILDKSETISLLFLIPPDVFTNNAGDIELKISWDSALACQQSVTTVVNIDLDSRLVIPYSEQEIRPQLNDFPAPFFSETNVNSSPTALILPKNPDEDELSALIATSAGIGKQTKGAASFEVFYINEIKQINLKDYHLIVISKEDSLGEILGGYIDKIFPEEVGASRDGGNGSISVFSSPWNPGRALMVVTGVDGSGLQKASAAVAANDFLTISDGYQANITEISDQLSNVQWQLDQEIGELINEDALYIGRLGKSSVTIPFYVPGTMPINPEAYIELYYRHSQLINYLQSSITVTLNDEVIGTIRFSDQSSSNGLARIILPPNSVRPLKNNLVLTFTIIPQDICADERSGNYWISVFRDSYLHLPPVLDATSAENRYFLGEIANAFLDKNSLSNLVFIAGRKDQLSWKYASELAFQLGALSTANTMLPLAEFPETYQKNPVEKDIILIGRTEAIPFTSGINDSLPLQFQTDGSIDKFSNEGIQFEVNNGQSFGILELISLGGNTNNALAIMGNTSDGLSAAYNSALERITNPQNEIINVEMIDQEMASHTFFIEANNIPDEEPDAAHRQWWDGLLDINSNKMAVYLLVIFVFVTLLFSFLAFRSSSKTKR